MFGIGPQELLIIVILFIIFLVVVGGVVFLIRLLFRPKKPNSFSNQSDRLKELQKMKNDSLITEDEFKKKRNEIMLRLTLFEQHFIT